MYKPFHLIGLELSISVLSAVLRQEPTGQARQMRGTVAAVAKRALTAGETLDDEGGYTVWGKAQPVAQAAEVLPIGLADHVRLVRDVSAGQILVLSDVDLAEDNATALYRQTLTEAV